MKLLTALWIFAMSAWADPKLMSLKVAPAEASITFAGATQQFVAVASYADGTEKDVTGEVKWSVSNPALAKVSNSARLAAVADGKVVVTAALPTGASAQSHVLIEGSQLPRPFSFPRDIGGILTKRGCNQAACHGSVKGRGGLKLSANALYPKDDHEWITKGGTYQVLTAGNQRGENPTRRREESRGQPALDKAHHGNSSRRRQALRKGFRGLPDDPYLDQERCSLRLRRRK